MPHLLTNRPLTLPVGKKVGPEELPFILNEPCLSRHLAVFGGSGSGKSKFLELLCRLLLDNYRGFCLIDPHGDLSEDILAYAAQETEKYQSDAMCKRIHYLEPSFETVFGLDPFEFRPSQSVPEELRENAYHAWLHTRADEVAEIVQRKQGQGDFQGMARLQRILRDVLIAVGTPVGSDGAHLPLADVLVLLDPHHPRHDDVFNLVNEHLPPEVRGDFASLQSYRSEEQRKRETESTVNRLRSLLSPIVKAIFSSSDNTIDFRSIIAKRGVLLVNLRKTDYFSADQRNAIGGLLIHEILSTAETTAREERAPYYLIVDEARLFIGQDLMEGLDQARKFKLSVCLAGQHLSQFKTEEYDMTPNILNNCGTVLCFQQKHPEDLDLWKRYFGYSNLAFEKHFQIMDRQHGYDFLDVEDRSETRTNGRSFNTTQSRSETHGQSHMESEGTSRQTGRNESRSLQTTEGNSYGKTLGQSRSTGSSLQRSPVFDNGSTVTFRTTMGTSETESESYQNSESQNYSKAQGHSIGQSESTGFNRGTSDGNSSSNTEGVSQGTGVSESDGTTTNYRKVPVPHLEEERLETPYLKNSVQDQFERFAQLQRTLPQQFALVSPAGTQESFVVRIGDVQPAYPDPKEMRIHLDTLKHKIFATHPYYQTPKLSPADQDRRLEKFLLLANAQPPAKEESGVTKDAGKDSGFLL